MILSLWHLEYRWFTGNWAHIIIWKQDKHILKDILICQKKHKRLTLFPMWCHVFLKSPPKNKPTPTKYRDLTNENPPSSAFPLRPSDQDLDAEKSATSGKISDFIRCRRKVTRRFNLFEPWVQFCFTSSPHPSKNNKMYRHVRFGLFVCYCCNLF